MPAALLYYISGHGFGHALRCAQTVRVLKGRYPDLPIHVRTLADPAIFRDLPVHFEPVAIDRGAIEIDALNINWPATLDSVRNLIAGKETFVAREADYIRKQGISLIIADVPFMAGYVAQAASVPCFAQCNFMWDWIYEPHTADRDLLEAIRGGYRLMQRHLRLPFPHPCSHFVEVIDVPFITSPPTLSAEQVRAQMAIAPSDTRPIILIAMRGGTSPAITSNLRKIENDYHFITTGGQLSSQSTINNQQLLFWNAMQISDAVVSKPGHGIVTDCATLGVALLYPARNGFREDPMILAEGSRYFRAQEITPSDYAHGNWKPSLDALLEQPRPTPASNTNGAQFVAALIARHLRL